MTNASHPSTAHLPARWNYVEEVYNFRSDPRQANVSLLMSVEDDSYIDPYKDAQIAKQGSPHPIAWYRDGGRLGPNATVPVQASTAGDVEDPYVATYDADRSDVAGILGAAAPVDTTLVMPGRMWYVSSHLLLKQDKES